MPETTIELPASEAERRAVFVEHAIDVFWRNGRGTDAYVLKVFLHEAAQRRGELTLAPEDFGALLHGLNEERDRVRQLAELAESARNLNTGDDIQRVLNGILAIGGAAGGMAGHAIASYGTTLVGGILDLGGMVVEDVFSDSAQVIAQLQSLDITRYFGQNAREDLLTALDWAAVDPVFQAAFDTHFHGVLGVETTASKEQILVANTALANRLLTQEGVGILKEIRELLGEAAAGDALHDENTKRLLQALIKASRTTREAADTARSERESSETGELTEARRQQLLAQHDFAMREAQAAHFLISTALQLIDPKLAREVGAIIGGAFKVADAIARFDLAKAALRSELVLTADIVGAVVGIFSAFSGGPTFEEVVIEQLQELREQVHELHVFTAKQFEYVHQKLDHIFEVMTDGFQAILERLATHEYHFDDIKNRVARIEHQVVRLRRQSLDWARRRASEERRRLFNRALTTRERHADAADPTDYMSGDRLDECLSDFRSFATESATTFALDGRELFGVGLFDDALKLETVADALADPYTQVDLAGRLSLLFAPDMTSWVETSAIPDPLQFGLAAEAYLKTVSNWPEYTAYPETDVTVDLEPMLREGVKVRRFAERLAREYDGDAQTAFWTSLLARTRRHVDAMLQAVYNLEDDYRVTAGFKGDATTLNLWRAIDQATDYTSPEAAVIRTAIFPAIAHPELPLTPKIREMIPAEYWFAEQLGLGQVRTLYGLFWTMDEPSMPGIHLMFDFVSDGLTNGDPVEYPLDERGKHVFRIVHRSIHRADFGPEQVSSDSMIAWWESNWTDGKKVADLFVEQSVDSLGHFCIGPIFTEGRSREDCIEREKAAPDNHLKQMREILESKVQVHRSVLRGEYIQQCRSIAEQGLSSSSIERVRLPRARMMLMRSALTAFTTLAFSKTINDDRELHALLHGQPALPTPDELVASLGALIALEPDSNVALLLDAMSERAGKTLDDIEARINELLARPEAVERLEPVDGTLRKLRWLNDARLAEMAEDEV